MTRANFNPKTKAAMFLRSGGQCEGMVDDSGHYVGARGDSGEGWRRCGASIGHGPGWHADHIVPDALSGLNDAENGQCLCVCCHAEKTGRQDAPAIAKAKRLERREMGIKRQPKAVIPGSKTSRWKRKLDGTVVPRAALLACLMLAGDAGAHEDRHEAEITGCYDGDTCRGTIDLGMNVRAHDVTLRLLGFDTPEIRGACEYERALAREARDRLLEVLATGAVSVELHGPDRYGRTLARVFVDGIDVAGIMIGLGLARPYEGGWREGWCDDG